MYDTHQPPYLETHTNPTHAHKRPATTHRPTHRAHRVLGEITETAVAHLISGVASRVRRERRNTIILGIERWRVGKETIRSPQPVLLTMWICSGGAPGVLDPCHHGYRQDWRHQMTKEKKSRLTKSDHDQFFFSGPLPVRISR
jgi:hypothetical protein